MDVIWDMLVAAVIFGALATGPIITWLAIAWLVTDRRRSTSPPARS